MKIDNIWEGFKNLFPDYEDKVESYSKIGSKTIKIKMKTQDESDKFLIFLYNDPFDWTFGTKVWRVRPRKKAQNNIDKVLEEVKNENSSDDNK